jgi:hypothetical protein
MNTLEAAVSIAPYVVGGRTYDEAGLTYDGLGFSYNDNSVPLVTTTITARARLMRQQGWPIPDIEDPGFLTWVDTRLYAKTHVTNLIALTARTLRVKARISSPEKPQFSARVRVVSGQTIKARVRIEPLFRTNVLPVSFSIRQVEEQALRMLFYTRGQTGFQSFKAKTRIVHSDEARVVGHFIVVTPSGMIHGILPVKDPQGSSKTLQTASMRVRIARQ